MDCKIGKQLFYCIGAAFLVFLVFKLSFDHMIKREFQPIIYKYNSTVHVDSLSDILAKSENINLQELVNRVDKSTEEIKEIGKHYQDDINLMIYKTTQWLEFWLGIATIVLTLFTIIQYFRMRNYDSYIEREIGKMHNTANEKFSNTDNRIRLYIENMEHRLKVYTEQVDNKIDQKYKNAEEKVAYMTDALDSLGLNIEQTNTENVVSSLMLCISSFPDPAMFGSIPKKKFYLRFYLTRLHDAFDQYVKLKDLNKMSDDDTNKLSVVLASLKYVAVRSQNVFSSYHQNITFDKLLKDINAPLVDIVEKNVLPEDIKDKLSSISNTFKTMINDISIEEMVHD